jgi:5-methylcytosine-specific restriction endonuclease McrA
MPRKLCTCGRIALSGTTRCATHLKQNARNTYAYQQARARVYAEETVCWICHKPVRADEKRSADHVIAVARGGTSTRDNLRLAHLTCNSRRGAG